MKLTVAIYFGKLISFISRTLKIGGGSAAPGLYALKVEPDLVQKMAQKIPKNVVITGTNGKTTTARILAHLAQAAGLKTIRNQTGSNLERGVASALLSSVIPLTKYNLGIWELDEFAFNNVAPKIKPDMVVFLNVFRDQLDRYGEVNTVVNRWQETIKKLPKKTIILVNGDDVNTLKLKQSQQAKILTFGVENYKITGESLETESTPKKLDYEAKNVKLDGLNGSSFSLIFNLKSLIINLPIPGIYHIYDAVAALTAFSHINTLTHQLTDTLVNFQPAFGRVEKLPFGYIFLIKNPAGATQVLETITPQIESGDRFLIALNDNLADGTDVSWIWDAEFDRLQETGYRGQVICSGKRAYDMAVRLKYAGFETEQINVQPNIEKALKEARVGLKGSLFILPTYTALLTLQSILTKLGVKSHYWQSD